MSEEEKKKIHRGQKLVVKAPKMPDPTFPIMQLHIFIATPVCACDLAEGGRQVINLIRKVSLCVSFLIV